jgi:2,5-diketo-D-gluconate reductase A
MLTFPTRHREGQRIMNTVPTTTLNNGTDMPQLGFGVWQVADDEAHTAVATALQQGYRSIDTAALYKNEAGVGRAIAESGITRDQLFITTKVWNDDQGYDATLRAFDTSLNKLGLDYVDLYLIHWPQQARNLYTQSWQALERLYAEKRARTIGVSNFQPAHLDRLAIEADIVPAVNQIELHPHLNQQALRDYHAAHGIKTEAWSPLGQGGTLLDEPAIRDIATAHGKTTAQVVLRWHLQLGNIVIPKSVTPSRIAENIQVFDFDLSESEMSAIGGLNTDTRLGPDPDQFDGS